MTSQFFFSLASIKPQQSYEGGSLTYVTSKETPGFVNISFANLRLNHKAFLKPIWHPNANKIGYCTEGKVFVSMRTPNSLETFTVQDGEIFFIPQGYIHSIENIDKSGSVIHFALNHSNPETMSLEKAIGSISESVFNSTFGTSPQFFNGLKKSKNNDLIKTLQHGKVVPTSITNRYKFNIKESQKTVQTNGGYLQLGIKPNLSVLQGLGILGFGLNPKGIVEPHWHTNAGELVYIVKGKTRITVLSPNGLTEVMEVKGGEGAFAPASHFHNIENIGADEVEVIAFFSHAEPDYIGIGEVVGSYSNEELASIFNLESNYFEQLPKPSGPLVIVPI